MQRRPRGLASVIAIIAGLGLGVVVGGALLTLIPFDTTVVKILTAISRVSAVVGTYGVLWMIVLVARVPWIERTVGHDRLVSLHKKVSPWALWLVVVHVVVSVAAYSWPSLSKWLEVFVTLNTSVGWILPATAGFVLMAVAGLTSWRRARGRLPRQVWWTVHLYFYLAVALAFMHQLTVDGPFLHGWARWVWIGYYIALVVLIVVFRVAVPLAVSLRHRLAVERVVSEGNGVVSVWISGRHLDRLPVAPGQFANWRFMAPGLMYEAHPYSFSSVARSGLVRITVKDLGDASHKVASLKPGTRVLMEGPFGVVTPARLSSRGHSVLVAGGVGIAPVRVLAEALAARGVRVDVITRWSQEADVALGRELHALETWPGVAVHELVGPRAQFPLDAAHMAQLVPDIAQADVYVCGPQGLTDRVLASARELGVPGNHLHSEDFVM